MLFMIISFLAHPVRFVRDMRAYPARLEAQNDELRSIVARYDRHIIEDRAHSHCPLREESEARMCCG